jgi:hypothetical protein
MKAERIVTAFIMDNSLREQLRLNLLLQAEAASTLGLSDAAFLLGARTQGYRADETRVKTELQYLVDKEFLAPAPKAISPELSKHRITAAGRDFLASNGH